MEVVQFVEKIWIVKPIGFLGVAWIRRTRKWIVWCICWKYSVEKAGLVYLL